MEARELHVIGRVQGVGFRPFVKRLAETHRVTGWVRNHAGSVTVFVQGEPTALDAFSADIIARAPPLAEPSLASFRPSTCVKADSFDILASSSGDPSDAHVPPDHFACDECLDELRDPSERRHRYPFINCTQCGPRYTIIQRLPYDRANTSMSDFPLCSSCRAEYEDPLDRRYHAQPLACPKCGPELTFHRSGAGPIRGTERALSQCARMLRDGLIVAAKGIGGYHLICDALREDAVARLRRNKSRPHKPLAVMVRARGADGLDEARLFAHLGPAEAAMLSNPVRPIVLVKRRADATLASNIAPGLGEIGLMLPYSPLHYLLLEEFGGPVVATSGNLSGEPVITDAPEAEQRLRCVADAFLHHNRPIYRPADDPVYRVIADHPRPIRHGRGTAPVNMSLPFTLKQPVLAVGGQLKVTVALGWSDRAVISPHIGDMGSLRSQVIFEQVIGDLQALYGVKAERIFCDAHPHYSSSQWVRDADLPVTRVLHHHAHASALAGEHGMSEPVLVFAWDGVGYGADGTLWGGEALYGRPGNWRRVGSFRPFALPGGDKAGREPWRSALALCWEAGETWRNNRHESDILFKAWQRRVNAPRSSAVGRLFDAAAALTGVVETASFEGQGPMQLEALSARHAEPLALPLERGADDVWRTDWAPFLAPLQDDGIDMSQRGAVFHASLAQALVEQAKRVRDETDVRYVGLTGGVFQNKLLTEMAYDRLTVHGFSVLLANRIPCNDAGISYGQLIEAGGESMMGARMQWVSQDQQQPKPSV